MLERVGLGGAGKRRVGDYSLGMRQRLGIGTALLGDPAVLILDEPANGMDPEGIRWMRLLLHDFAAGGGTVLLSSHLLGEVQATVDRLVVIGGGRIVADDTPRSRCSPARARPSAASTPAALDAALRRAGFETRAPIDGALRVRRHRRAGRARRRRQPAGPARAARRRRRRPGGAVLRAHQRHDRDARHGRRRLTPTSPDTERDPR